MACRTVLPDRLALGNRAALAHIDGAFQDKGQTLGDFAGLHDRRAGGEMANLAEPAQTGKIVIVQMGEHLVAARLQDRRIVSHKAKRTEGLRQRHPRTSAELACYSPKLRRYDAEPFSA